MKLDFTGKIWKTGNSYVVTIPNDYIKFGQLNEELEHKFSIETQEVLKEVD